MMTALLLSALAVPPESLNDTYKAAARDLAIASVKDQGWYRYLAPWPHPVPSHSQLASSVSFWSNSTSWSPELRALVAVEDGALWRIDLRQLGWSKEVWEKIVADDPYFAVTTKNKNGKLIRGWLDPEIEHAVRLATGSSKAVVRADWFLVRTSTDEADGRFKGHYSTLLGLPDTEKDLDVILGTKVEQKINTTTLFQKLFLIRGDAVKESIVAPNGRGLERTPTSVGRDGIAFKWKTLDVSDSAGEKSVAKKLAGTIDADGGEIIFSLPNGLHGYYLINKAGKKVSQVPTNIAQDTKHAHDSIVYNAWKCVRCHQPNSGINGFDGVIRRQAKAREVGLAIVGVSGVAEYLEFQQKVEAYYSGDFALSTKNARESYGLAVERASGLSVVECQKNYLFWVESYLFGRMGILEVQNESGLGEEIRTYIKLSGSPDLLDLLEGGTISRSQFESEFSTLMQAKIWDWEVKEK